jgi:hypothetical protein
MGRGRRIVGESQEKQGEGGEERKKVRRAREKHEAESEKK